MLNKPPAYYANKYKNEFMALAITASTFSVAKRKQVGCVLYLNNHTHSIGFNAQCPDSEDESCEILENGVMVTKDSVHHAEYNCITKVEDKDLICNSVMYVTLSPCIKCAELIANAGVSKVYYLEEYRDRKGIDYLLSAGVLCEQINNHTGN